MKSCYISMQHYAAVNHICNALKHNAEVEVEVYGENKKGEMPKKENARAYFLAFDDVEKVDFQEFPEELFPCINTETLEGKTVYEFNVKERNKVVHAVQVVVEDDFCPSSYEVAHLIQEDYGTLSCEELTHGMNGYPERVRAILVGFDSFEDAEEVAKDFGVHVDVFRIRDGWNFWEKAGAVMWDADKTEWREDVYKYAVGVDCTQYDNE